MSQIERSKWDALSRWHAQRKLHPGIDAQNGAQFPSERQPESASRNRRSEWDALSRRSSLRKACPRMKTQNGMQFPPEDDSESASILSIDSGLQFPVEGCSGKCVPFQARIPGCTFRLKLQPESASHSERQFRDAVSAPNKRPRLAMELGPKAQHIQLMLSANSPSAMAVRAPPYPR